MIKKIIKYLILLLVIVIIAIVYYQMEYNINNIPSGEFQEELISPNQQYALKSYIIDGGSSINGDATRVELIDYNTGKKYNIYYNYPEYNVEMKWINDKVVEINGKRLNVFKDTFYWKRDR